MMSDPTLERSVTPHLTSKTSSDGALPSALHIAMRATASKESVVGNA